MKILVGAALAGCGWVGAPAPAGAEPHPFSALSCDCQQTAAAGSTKDEIERGIRDGLRVAPLGPS